MGGHASEEMHLFFQEPFEDSIVHLCLIDVAIFQAFEDVKTEGLQTTIGV